MNILVFGLGRSGEAVLDLIEDNVYIFDLKKQDVSHLSKDNRFFYFEELPVDLDYDLVIKNPGISFEILEKYILKDVPIITEIQYAMNFNKKPLYIGITGSNGKTTTCTLLHEILKTQYSNLYLAGNIGLPLSSIVNSLDENSIVITEVSSFQLKTKGYDSFPFTIGAITNFSFAHLDYHGSVEDYFSSKLNILQKNKYSFVNKDSDLLFDLTKKNEYDFFSLKEDKDIEITDYLIFKKEKIIKICDIALKGQHNLENIILCLKIAKKLEISNSNIAKVLKSFSGVKHRLNLVKKTKINSYYNDSKATNVESTLTALKSFEVAVILLCGGLERFQDLTPLLAYKNKIHEIVCYGENSFRIKEFCESNKIIVHNFRNLEESFEYCKEKHGIILFSPFSASWDQFQNFEERGELFEKLVRSIL